MGVGARPKVKKKIKGVGEEDKKWVFDRGKIKALIKNDLDHKKPLN